MVKAHTKKIIYRFYPLKKIIVVNDLEFKEIIIDPHYEENHSSYMNDEKILVIADQLKYKTFIPHRKGKLLDGTE